MSNEFKHLSIKFMKFLCKKYNQQILYILFVMGVQTSNQQNNVKKQTKLIKKYHQTKVFLKNKKSTAQFYRQIESISKRAGCLDYKWAADLLNFLKLKEENALYIEYKSVLRENCQREGKKQKIFGSSMIEKSFYECLKQKNKKYNQSINMSELKQLFQETKAYFMVKEWLSRLTYTQKFSQDQQNCRSYESRKMIDEQEKIMEIMANLSIQMYKNTYPICQIPQKSYQKAQFYSNIQIFSLFKNLHRKMTFLERQILIQKIQICLMKDIPNMKLNVQKIVYFFGKQIIFGYLFTIKQIGRINISFLWQNFFGNTLLDKQLYQRT